MIILLKERSHRLETQLLKVYLFFKSFFFFFHPKHHKCKPVNKKKNVPVLNII